MEHVSKLSLFGSSSYFLTIFLHDSAWIFAKKFRNHIKNIKNAIAFIKSGLGAEKITRKNETVKTTNISQCDPT